MPDTSLTLVTPTRSASAEQQAYDYLHQAICTGELAPGARIVTEDIAQLLDMSRMPVREALRRLSVAGLVAIRPNRGAVVTRLNVEDMREIFEMRSALEGLAIRLAAPQVTDRQIVTLERLLEDMEGCEQNSQEWLQRHRQFHATIVTAAARPRLAAQIDSLYALLDPYMRIWLQNPAKPRTPRAAHEQLISVLKARDSRLAEHTLNSHIEGTVPLILSFVQQQEHAQVRR
ncbi:GntR family transcriptional regulator [Achromobacter sp. GG226]|uniref:GntR family transcriptional regulator n=1 Tax=Verticiella alkaliphila TaxID=2779529 RepID=UPI001C0E3C28|nr:GntR family transcriptional regulator [Verticiella sp. GG226]MBU4609363.1 GntR family transcriptional regulator [Verticiella sp. GG226]